MSAYQIPLFDHSEPVNLDRVVNVASVPQRSPFRYPGGKTWLIPHVRRWLACRSKRPGLFIEPFAGGGIVSLTVGAEKLAENVVMVELDQDVAAVWQTIFNGGAQWLAGQIAGFDLSHENVQAVFSQHELDRNSRAFATILKNRVLHGGILAPGSGLVKHGENGKGLRSRWYPETLQRRILAIHDIRDRFDFIHGDGIEVMREHAQRRDAMYFIDPPYTAGGKRAGRRLYVHCELDHAELFRVTAALAGDFLMTYDDAPELHELANQHGFDTLLVSMQNTHLAKMKELLIGRNLDWAR